MNSTVMNVTLNDPRYDKLLDLMVDVLDHYNSTHPPSASDDNGYFIFMILFVILGICSMAIFITKVVCPYLYRKLQEKKKKENDPSVTDWAKINKRERGLMERERRVRDWKDLERRTKEAERVGRELDEMEKGLKDKNH